MSLLYILLVFQAFIIASFAGETCNETNSEVLLEQEKGNTTYSYRPQNQGCDLKIPGTKRYDVLFLRVHSISVPKDETNAKIYVLISDTAMLMKTNWCLFLIPNSSLCEQRKIFINMPNKESCPRYSVLTAESPDKVFARNEYCNRSTCSFEIEHKYTNCSQTESTASVSTTSSSTSPSTFTSTTMNSRKEAETPLVELAATTPQPDSNVIESSSSVNNLGYSAPLMIVPLAVVSALLATSWIVILIMKLRKKKAQTPQDDEQDNPQDDEASEMVVNEIYGVQPANAADLQRRPSGNSAVQHANAADVQRQPAGDVLYTIVGRR